ncbi:MAG: hypothetical protein RJB62_2039 [Pseudomonadota bacterium]|jgi:uncharacterized protein (DUF934 family)
MLVKSGAISDDPYIRLKDDEALPAQAVIVSLKRFLGDKDLLLAHDLPLGVLLESSESPEALEESLHQLALVVLNVPYFRDGRAFSWARMLRTRLKFKGEIRVTGHVLRDQIAFFVRVGVDAFELQQNLSLDDFNAALNEITNVYQPSVDKRATILDLRECSGAVRSGR